MFTDDPVNGCLRQVLCVAEPPATGPLGLVGTLPTWSATAISSRELAYFAADPQYLGAFPPSTTCGRTWLGMVTELEVDLSRRRVHNAGK